MEYGPFIGGDPSPTLLLPPILFDSAPKLKIIIINNKILIRLLLREKKNKIGLYQLKSQINYRYV